MDPVIGAAIVEGVGNLAGGILGLSGSRSNQKRQMAHNKEILRLQQEYNNTVLDRQEAWNDESNHRARIEAAGYNPYLYGQGVAGQSYGSGSSSMPGSIGQGGEQYLADAMKSSFGSAGSIVGTMLDNDAKRVSNSRAKVQQKIEEDAAGVTSADGRTLGQVQGDKIIAESEAAKSVARIQSVDATFKELEQSWREKYAVDDAGNPLLDQNGQPLSNYDVTAQSELDGKLKALKKIQVDIDNGKLSGDLTKIEKQIRENYRDYIQPEEAREIAMRIRKTQSDIETNEKLQNVYTTSALVNIANEANIRSQTETNNQMRPWVVSNEFWNSRMNKFNYLGEVGKAKALQEFNNSDYGKFLNTWVSPTINAIGGPLLGAVGGFGGGAVMRKLAPKPVKIKGFHNAGGSKPRFGF